MKALKLLVCISFLVCQGSAFALNDTPLSIAKLMSGKSTTEATQTKQAPSDSEITAKVKETFVKEKLFGKEDTAAMGISVKTSKGIVTLSGKAQSQEEVDMAVNLAKSVEGVKDVKSKIKVKPAKKK